MDKPTILQISTIWVPTGPNITYAGTERVVRYLDSVYTKQGYKSIVAAPGNSEVDGELFTTVPTSVWDLTGANGERNIVRDDNLYTAHHKRILDLILQEGEFSGGETPRIDIVHDHPGTSLLASRQYSERGANVRAPILTTLHGKVVLDEKNLRKYQLWRELQLSGRPVYFNAISQSQRAKFEDFVDIADVIYHGLPLERFPFEDEKGDYLFSMGRICEIKGNDVAIEVAKRTGMRLVLAGEVHSPDMPFFKERIEPYIDGDQIRFIGPLTDEQKVEWYKRATAFLMPIKWSEPFGLVMIEAMACGTPVIAFNQGSVPEVIEHGKTGFVTETLEEMVWSVKHLSSISPYACRARVEENFSIEEEAKNYLNLYKRIIQESD